MGDGMSSSALSGQLSEYLDLTWTAMWPKSSASVSVPDGEDADIVNKEMKAWEADIQVKSTASGGDHRSTERSCYPDRELVLIQIHTCSSV